MPHIRVGEVDGCSAGNGRFARALRSLVVDRAGYVCGCTSGRTERRASVVVSSDPLAGTTHSATSYEVDVPRAELDCVEARLDDVTRAWLALVHESPVWVPSTAGASSTWDFEEIVCEPSAVEESAQPSNAWMSSHPHGLSPEDDFDPGPCRLESSLSTTFTFRWPVP